MKPRNIKTIAGLALCSFGIYSAVLAAETVSLQDYTYQDNTVRYEHRTMFLIGSFTKPARLAPPKTRASNNKLLFPLVIKQPKRPTVLEKGFLVTPIIEERKAVPGAKNKEREKTKLVKPVNTVSCSVPVPSVVQVSTVKSKQPSTKDVANAKAPTIITDAISMPVAPPKAAVKPQLQTTIKRKKQKVSSAKTSVVVNVTKAAKPPVKMTTKKIKSTNEKNVKGRCEAPTVQFKWASTWVHPKTAEGLVNSLKDCGVKKVRVVGYTCDLGNKCVNDRMALGRAKVVAKILKKKGFEVVEVKGKGKSDYLTNDPNNRKLNRRVEVLVAG